MEKTLKNELLLFAKYPEPGKVKTRLSKTIGPQKAAKIYKAMVEEVMRRTSPCDGEYIRLLYYDPPELGKKFDSWLSFRHRKPQQGADLGEKIKNAFTESLTTAEKAILIGTDCIDIDHALILNAFDRLSRTDLVLGPAKDGGYYLIGCKKNYPELFSHIEWSTERVFLQTLKMADSLKLSVSLLQELEDIDAGEQLWRLKNII